MCIFLKYFLEDYSAFWNDHTKWQALKFWKLNYFAWHMTSSSCTLYTNSSKHATSIQIESTIVFQASELIRKVRWENVPCEAARRILSLTIRWMSRPLLSVWPIHFENLGESAEQSESESPFVLSSQSTPFSAPILTTGFRLHAHVRRRAEILQVAEQNMVCIALLIARPVSWAEYPPGLGRLHSAKLSMGTGTARGNFATVLRNELSN